MLQMSVLYAIFLLSNTLKLKQSYSFTLNQSIVFSGLTKKI